MIAQSDIENTLHESVRDKHVVYVLSTGHVTC